MDLTSYLPAVRQHGLITWTQALEAGLEPRDIAALVSSHAWWRVRKGVYVDHAHWQALDPFRGQPLVRIRAVHLVLKTPHVFSHDSAGLLLGMGCPDGRTALVHVTRRDVTGGRIRAGVKQHGAPYDAGDVVSVDGLPVLGAARTALDISREHGTDHGLAATDAALRLGVTVDEIAARLEPMHHWPGVRAAATAVDLADAGSESWVESRGRFFVHELGLGTPETQFGLRFGHKTAWADLRIGRHLFEIDGKAKYLSTDPTAASGGETLWKEKLRQDFLTGFKLGMSRLTQTDLGHGRVAARGRVLREFADTCERFGTDISDLAPYLLSKVSGRRPGASAP